MPTFFLTAAEHSGDALGAALIHALRRQVHDAQFVGVGGPKMEAAGCRLLANPVARSAMLIGALFTEYRYWSKLLKRIRTEIRLIKPAVVIPIDSSTVNLRIAKIGREEKIPVCYYVAPQVWASRPWRVKKIAAWVDTLCCIFPFEPDYFRPRNVNAVYVGHPMFDTRPITDDAIAKVDPPLPGLTPLPDEEPAPRIALFPGSRRGEVKNNMPPMLAVLSEIKARFPRAIAVAVAPSEERAWQMRHLLNTANQPVEIRVGHNDEIIRWADLVLTKSGTITVQIARQHRAMVVMYALAWYKWHFVGRWIIITRFIAMVNILAGRELVPEFIPFYGSPVRVARACIDLMAKPDRRRAMEAELAQIVAPLGPRAGVLAADRVADEVLKYLNPPSKQPLPPPIQSPTSPV